MEESEGDERRVEATMVSMGVRRSRLWGLDGLTDCHDCVDRETTEMGCTYVGEFCSFLNSSRDF